MIPVFIIPIYSILCWYYVNDLVWQAALGRMGAYCFDIHAQKAYACLKMRHARLVTLLILLVSALIALGAMFVEVPGILPLGAALMVSMAALLLGAAIVFLMSLKGFSRELKRAYLLLSIGITLLGIVQLQLPVSSLLGVQEAYWYKGALQPFTFIGAIGTIFVGTRAFAKLFRIRGLSTSWLFAIGAFAVAGVLIAFLPHAPIRATEAEFDAHNVATVLSVVFMLMATVQVLQIKRVASVMYTKALAWLALGFGLEGATGVVYVVYRLILGESDFFLLYNPVIVGIAFTAAALCLLRSAYSFAIIQDDGQAVAPGRSKTFFGRTPRPTSVAAVSSVDIVTFTATLVSDSRQIDPLLDKVRMITATRREGQNLSDEDQTALLGVYLKLEDYLVTTENIREFDRASLRDKVEAHFRLTGKTNTFWDKLPSIQ